MKILKIEDSKGFFSLDGEKWFEIDVLTKDNILTILDLVISGKADMDAYSEETLKQPAHRIIYKNLYNKLNELSSNRNRFKQESELMYRDVLEKYGMPLSKE